MVFLAFSILNVVVLGLCAAEKFDLPLPTCKRNSNDYNSCLKRAMNEAWPMFVKGLPAEFEFPPLDPFFYEYERAIIDNGLIHGEATMSNATIEGFKDSHFADVRPHFSNDSFRLVFYLHTPKVFLNGFYGAKGSLGTFQLNSGGYFNISAEGIKTMWDISGLVKNDTWIIEHVLIFPTYKKNKIFMDNLVDGNRELSEFVLNFVNENLPFLSRIVAPISTQILDTFFTKLLKPLFEKLSFSKLFPV